MKIIAAIPLYKGVEPKSTMGLFNTLLTAQREYPSSTIQVKTTNRIYIWAAREILKDVFLKMNYDYLFYIDEDMVLDPTTLTRLLAHKVQMISALSFIRYQPHFAMYGNFNKNHEFVCNKDVIPNKPFYQDATGLGCCLLHRSCFDGAPKPLFMPKENYLSEDLAFFSAQNKRGYRVLIDPNIEIGHVSVENPIITREDYERNQKSFGMKHK